MKILLQRVRSATLTAWTHSQTQTGEAETPYTASIGQGLLIYVSIGKEDQTFNEEGFAPLAARIFNAKLFSQSFVASENEPSSNHPVPSNHTKTSPSSPSSSTRLAYSLADIGGDVLLVSQITLHGTLAPSGKPSFDQSAPPALARQLYEAFLRALDKQCLLSGSNNSQSNNNSSKPSRQSNLASGVFGANMRIEADLVGPVTFTLP